MKKEFFSFYADEIKKDWENARIFLVDFAHSVSFFEGLISASLSSNFLPLIACFVWPTRPSPLVSETSIQSLRQPQYQLIFISVVFNIPTPPPPHFGSLLISFTFLEFSYTFKVIRYTFPNISGYFVAWRF